MIAILLVILAVLVVVGVRHQARHRSGDGDLRRVGDDSPVDAREAARRAQGRSAWTRFIGGGGL